MSAGFCTSYNDIIKRNIRHIYSGIPPPEIRFRVSQYHTGIDVTERIHLQQQTRPRSQNRIRKSFQYMEDYGAFIPRAPAFEVLTRKRVSNVVDRLYSRKVQEQRQLLRRSNRSKSATIPSKSEKKSDSSGHIRTQSDVNDIVTRLYRSHTFCSTTKMRNKQPEVTQRSKGGYSKTADDTQNTDDHVIDLVDSHNTQPDNDKKAVDK